MTATEYWAGRGEARERAAQAFSGKTAALVRKAYNKAFDDIEAAIAKIRRKYPDLDDADAASARWRAERLKEVQADIGEAIRRLGNYEADITAKTYAEVMSSGYYRFLYDVQQGLNIGFNVAQIPEGAIKKALETPWVGEKTFSKRVWENTEIIAEKAGGVITAGLMSGASVTDMAAELAVINGAGKYAAERLIRTETNYFCNRGELLAYNEAGIEEYRYLATLDNRTSQACIDHDGIVYKVSEAVVGDNYPPLHVFCRSTTVAWFGDAAIEGMERRARNPETGELYKVPSSMGYKEWRETFVKNALPGETDSPPNVTLAKSLTEFAKPDTINAVGGGGVEVIGRIDRTKFVGIAENIVTDEVVLTDERAQHIVDRRGGSFLEQYGASFADVIESPDYIFRDHKPNTAIVSKKVAVDGQHINIVLRLAVDGDVQGRTNSIITAIAEGNKSFARRLRKFTTIYKTVDNKE